MMIISNISHFSRFIRHPITVHVHQQWLILRHPLRAVEIQSPLQIRISPSTAGMAYLLRNQHLVSLQKNSVLVGGIFRLQGCSDE